MAVLGTDLRSVNTTMVRELACIATAPECHHARAHVAGPVPGSQKCSPCSPTSPVEANNRWGGRQALLFRRKTTRWTTVSGTTTCQRGAHCSRRCVTTSTTAHTREANRQSKAPSAPRTLGPAASKRSPNIKSLGGCRDRCLVTSASGGSKRERALARRTGRKCAGGANAARASGVHVDMASERGSFLCRAKIAE